METVSFKKMEDGTKEEYAFLEPLYIQCREGIPEMLLGLLKRMQGDRLGYQIDRYQHSLQTATRAEHGMVRMKKPLSVLCCMISVMF